MNAARLCRPSIATRSAWARLALLGVSTLAFCSCKAMQSGPSGAGAPQSLTAAGAPSSTSAGPPPGAAIAPLDTLPSQAFTGGPGDGYTIPAGARPYRHAPPGAPPLPIMLTTPWAPPGMEQPWPHDEYLHDGGDREVQVTVGPEFEVQGLDMEDTVVHYDTIDGRTIIKPSNRVCIYSPRFAAVRRVETPLINLQRDQVVQNKLEQQPLLEKENLPVTTAVQPLQPIGEIGIKQPSLERLKQGEGRATAVLQLAEFDGPLKAYEDFQVIRFGIYAQAEKPRLAESVDAAITWSHDKGVQVILDKQQAAVAAGDQRAQVTFRVDVPNNPCLRVCKVASTNTARPGDVIDFTIRFDNIGDQQIGNVTLIDNLTPRLEYIPDSAKSSRKAEFFTEQNEGDSLVLRWEFAEPLPAGQGGLVRFHCRVR